MKPTPAARLLLLGAGSAGVFLFCSCSSVEVRAPDLVGTPSAPDEGYGWRPDPAVIERAAQLYDGDDPAKQESAYDKAFYEFYHSSPDNAVPDWQIAQRTEALYSGTDPKKKKAAYRQAYYEMWHRYPPAGAAIPDTAQWIDPSSPQERERRELGLDQPGKATTSKIGTK